MKDNTIIKRRRFALMTVLSEHDVANVKNKLKQLAGVIEITLEQSTMSISYDLQQTNYPEIKNHLRELVKLKDGNIFTQGLTGLICYCEENELDHENYKTNWQYYIQNLYLSLHKEIIE